MTAAEARYIAQSHVKEWYKNEINNIMEAISNVANDGFVSVKVVNKITDKTRHHLEVLGFEVVNDERVKW